MNATLSVGNREVSIDLSKPVSLAIELRFSAQSGQPRHFGAPPASSRPFAVPGFSGSVEHGASCNCQTLTLTPHCNGTHTECVGHLTREPADAYSIVPFGLLPALLLSVEPSEAKPGGESTEPTPQPGDSLITKSAILESWANANSNANTKTPADFAPSALVIRTLPNSPDKQHRDYTGQMPPYLSREAASLLVERGIEHLIVDLPSIDRSHDEGRLTAHRIFFGLPRGSTTLTQATRPRSTVTELAFIPDATPDGPYLLELQVPAFRGDAVPSRPLLYRLLSD